jgi:hypothetical protein
MLSAVLQRNATHEARISNISVLFVAIAKEITRDGKPGLALKAFGAALQLCFAQNDTDAMRTFRFAELKEQHK